ncbi:MAG TPA: hypothetical protein VEV63_02700, partial [Streptosporangiaceae bacterium]|nr:hypothetical protein [Streptosporangiaceae bacterium]
DPDDEICLAAPCRCTIPDASVYQPGLRDPNPAAGDQFVKFTEIECTVISGARGMLATPVAWAGPATPAIKPLSTMAAALNLKATFLIIGVTPFT